MMIFIALVLTISIVSADEMCDGNLRCVSVSECRNYGQQILKRLTCGTNTWSPKVCCKTKYINRIELPLPPECGVPMEGEGQRIVGGHPAKMGAWPWAAAIAFLSKIPGRTDQVHYMCGGTIITPRHILSAAHCSESATYTILGVVVGEVNINKFSSNDSPSQVISVDKIIVHEEYDTNKCVNDILLLKLKKEIVYSKYASPVCLPKSPELQSKDFLKYSGTIVGWGSQKYGGLSSKILREAIVPVERIDLCKKAFESQAEITSNQICAGSISTMNQDSCQGDSGGPLMITEGDYVYQIGVVSFGHECAVPGYPGVYTRVSKYIDWIEDHINI